MKSVLGFLAFTASIVIGFIALFLPPVGAIDSSVLWFTAQLLLFTSSLLGINFSLTGLREIFEKINVKGNKGK